MMEGVIPSSPTSFIQVLSKPVANQALATTLSTPHHSNRLAKKAFHYTLVLAMVQNVLMKKLGISSRGQLEATDFDKYIQMFKEGMSEWQVQMILELFKYDDTSFQSSTGLQVVQ
jgi:hypothetical protein